MPKYMLNKNQNLDQVEKLNYNREGSLLDFIDSFIDRFPKNVDEYENLLTDNRIWKQSTVGIGVVSPDRAIDLGFKMNRSLKNVICNSSDLNSRPSYFWVR